ncbi:MAG: hypothetical protein J6S64_02010, partial [Bacteroidales bacterium]|nr:hypothetical protein [Bacteroidales bacterium]
PSLDREAVRLVRSMPKWKPGTQRGEPIAMNYVIPVFFKWEYSGEEDGDEEQIINCFEDPAMFPGGVDALINYLHENLQYPEEGVYDYIDCGWYTAKVDPEKKYTLTVTVTPNTTAEHRVSFINMNVGDVSISIPIVQK